MSKKKETEKKVQMLVDDLASLERYVRELLKFLPTPICLTSPQGVVLEFNPAFEEVSGYKFHQAIGKNIRKLFGDESERLIREALEGKSLEEEITLYNKKGEEIPVTVFLRTRKDEEGQPVGLFISVFDLRRVREAEKELEQKVNQLQKFKELAVGRELKMVELKERIEELEKKINS